MNSDSPRPDSSKRPQEKEEALQGEMEQLTCLLAWLERHMPPSFLEEIDVSSRVMIARSLLNFSFQSHFAYIDLQHVAFVLSLDSPQADLLVLKHFSERVISSYHPFISNAPLPGMNEAFLRVTWIVFASLDAPHERISKKKQEVLRDELLALQPDLPLAEASSFLHQLTPHFLQKVRPKQLIQLLKLFTESKTSDVCQYAVHPSSKGLQLLFAWRNIPKANFIYRLVSLLQNRHLTIKKLNATYFNLYGPESTFFGVLEIEGTNDLSDFLREFALLKFFLLDALIETTFVQSKRLTGNQAYIIQSLLELTHQTLLYADPNLYAWEHIRADLCQSPDLTELLCALFELRFSPEQRNEQEYKSKKQNLLDLIGQLDTGNALQDLRRKSVLQMAVHIIDHILKTNFYCENKSAFSFRLHPHYLHFVPYDRKTKFPEIPFAIFFIHSPHFLGFHIRFKDLARGGVRTVIPDRAERFILERNAVFSEAYNLSLTQQKKNKDIPEGGSKATILLSPLEILRQEEEIYRRSMEEAKIDPKIISEKIIIYRREQKLAILYASQRSFIKSFMTLINCDETNKLRAPCVLDYWEKPEFIYLGPDENMHNVMIDWIANYSQTCGYRPGRSFMSSKPVGGINHKEYGVTSYGVNTYMHEVLLYLGIDPNKDTFTVKISGGPDGDVAGNQIMNLLRYYKKTARLVALSDVSGTILDPKGLDLEEMAKLFEQSLPIRHYPADKLSEGGFLLDLFQKREEVAYAQQTLCWQKKENKLIQEWLSGSAMNHLYRTNIHQAKADVFLPCGGRPRTLNETNWKGFLDEMGNPTSKAIVEGANLYLTPEARRELEKLGVIIIKDSSCNKGGVICSSFEVLAGLCLAEEEFIQEKPEYVKEVLAFIHQACRQEARLLLNEHRTTREFLTDISEHISAKINLFKYQLLDHFESIEFSKNVNPFLEQCLLLYCLPLLRKRYGDRIFQMPPIHQKAIIACALASHLVYQRGLQWNPSIIDVLPTLADDKTLLESFL